MVKKDDGCVEAYQRLAILHDMKGDGEAAKKFYGLALKNDPKNAEIYCDFGYSRYLRGDWPEAEKHLRRAIALNSECRRAHNNLGLLLARTNREADALAEFSKAGCSQADGHCNAALALASDERLVDAQRHFELALEADPKSPRATGGLAAIHSQSGKDNEQPEPVARAPMPSPAR